MASTPSRSNCQNAAGSLAPGNRQPMPMMAIVGLFVQDQLLVYLAHLQLM